MEPMSTELLEKIRQQFESAPYPNTPLEETPDRQYDTLLIHNLVTPYYLRNQGVIEPAGKVILDAGCGTGYKSLVLAKANPGAQVIGVDLSENAINLARKRMQYHGVENVEFYVASIADLPQLGYQFDYINCDEVLYLFEDVAGTLQTMKAVLKSNGMIRTNLHSATQRFDLFRAQQIFRVIGLLDSNPGDLEVEIAVETIRSLHDFVDIKAKTWLPEYENKDAKLGILMNYLLQGDKGYTIPDLFAALRRSHLEFVSMVNWRRWELLDLFQDASNLPMFWAMSLPEISIEQRLHLFDLMHPIHRLLDFWCGHPGQAVASIPVSEWSDTDWQHARVHLHPQLRSAHVKSAVIDSIEKHEPFVLSSYITMTANQPIPIESRQISQLLPLWNGPCSMVELVQRSLQLYPIDPITLEPVTPEAAFTQLKDLLTHLEVFLYVLLERS